jgi:hypothetical protein
MPLDSINRWTVGSIIVGTISWLFVLCLHLSESTFFSEVELLLLFSVGVVTPLSIKIIVEADRYGRIPRIFLITTKFQVIAILAVTIALVLEQSVIATLFASIWAIQTGLLALCGLSRMLQRPSIAPEELCIDFGLGYSTISGVWLVAYCAGYAFMSFDMAFVLLTAVHFTYISLGALIITGMIGRQLLSTNAWGTYRVIAWLTIVSPALVAIGITLTQFSNIRLVEVVSVVLLAGSFLLMGLLVIYKALPVRGIARGLTLLSSATLFLTMTYALAYYIGNATGWWALSLTQMVRWHGWFNAIGFVFFGLLGWGLDTPQSHPVLSGIPFSQLPWRWQTHPDFFERIGAIDLTKNIQPTGIVDYLQEYQQQGFSAESVSEAVAAFYEYTATHDLLVYPEWQSGFRFLARIYKQISKRVGQMNFPIHPDSDETQISSLIVPLSDALDRREKVRGWIRIYTKTGEAVYVAAYSSHEYQKHRYMNIAFPLPGGNLTSILRLATTETNKGGVVLSSFSTRQGDQGVYFANRLLPIRLPINETIEVFPEGVVYENYPANFPVGTILAKHTMWLFGIHFLTLHYSIKMK